MPTLRPPSMSPRAEAVGPEQRWRSIGMLGGAAVSAVCIALVWRKLDWAQAGAAMAGAKLWPWLPLSIVACVVGYVLRGFRCRLIVRTDTNLPRATAVNVVVVGYALNNLLPARAGELVRVALLSQRGGVSLVQAASVTLVERVLDGLTIVGIFAVSSAMLPEVPWARPLAMVATGIFGSAAAVLVFVALAPRVVFALCAWIAARLDGGLRDAILGLATSITRGVSLFRRPTDLARAIALSILVWAAEVSMFGLLLPAFGQPLRPSWAMFTQSVTNLGIILPSSPGFIGPWHYFGMRSASALGVPEATALSFATLVHLTFFVPITLWGIGAILRYGVEVGATIGLARRARKQRDAVERFGVPVHVVTMLDAPTALPTEASPFYLALVEAMIPSDQPELSSSVRASAVATSAAFLARQVERLPSRLRSLFGIGLFGFRLLVRLRWGRGFCDLPYARREAIVRAWTFGRFAPARQLMRLVRSISLLSYYDNPAVRETMAPRTSPPAEALVALRPKHIEASP